MPKFSEEEKVYYIPDHADSPDHRDAEIGRVRTIGSPVQPHRDRKYWVEYEDGSGVAKQTYERHLVSAEK